MTPSFPMVLIPVKLLFYILHQNKKFQTLSLVRGLKSTILKGEERGEERERDVLDFALIFAIY